MASSEKVSQGMIENGLAPYSKLYYQAVGGQSTKAVHASCSKVAGKSFLQFPNSHSLTDQCYHSLSRDFTILVSHKKPQTLNW